jgi:hypothetical protein
MDPFANPELNVKPIRVSKSKVTCPSRIEQLSVGAIRYSFLQMRSCPKLDVNYVLWTGLLAGHFALSYLLMSSSMQKKNKKNKTESTDEDITASAVDDELIAIENKINNDKTDDNVPPMEEVD